jgi:hypothetical protein
MRRAIRSIAMRSTSAGRTSISPARSPHLVAFRLTPDITRESSLLSLGAGNTVANDSLVFRIKYAYGQFNLDDWTAPGTWIRFG